MARMHKCNWHGCDRKVESWKWGCGEHFGRLPAGIRDRLVRVKRHWPEYKPINQEAKAFSRREEGIKPRKRPTHCDCGQPALKRLPIPECLDCHKKRVFGQIEKVTGD